MRRDTNTAVHSGKEEWGKTISQGKRRKKEILWLKGGIKRHVGLLAWENNISGVLQSSSEGYWPSREAGLGEQEGCKALVSSSESPNNRKVSCYQGKRLPFFHQQNFTTLSPNTPTTP